MSKLRTCIISGILVLVATVLMGSVYAFGNISYSYTPTGIVEDNITIKNIKVLSNIDKTRLDGPNIVGNDLNVDVDLEPYEKLTFKYDIVNNTNFDYELSKLIIECLNDQDVNNYLSVSLSYENGNMIKDKDIISKGTSRTVIVSISYDKNVDDIQTFLLNFDMKFNIR